MKTSTLFIGIVLIIINSVSGFIISDYKPFNIIMTDVSLLLTIAAIYGSSISKMADGFKIGLSFLLVITGIIRFICGLLASQEISNNIGLIVFLVVLGFEAICIFLGIALKDK